MTEPSRGVPGGRVEPSHDVPGASGPEPPAPAPAARTRGQTRDELARASLAPLGEHERPAPLVVAVALAAVLAVAVIVGALSIHGLSRHGGSLPGGIFLGCVLGGLAAGMYRRRYWAVLAFEALLAFQILVTSLALVVSSTLYAAGLCLVSIVLAGWLFWKLVRVMGRIQAGERAGASEPPLSDMISSGTHGWSRERDG